MPKREKPARKPPPTHEERLAAREAWKNMTVEERIAQRKAERDADPR